MEGQKEFEAAADPACASYKPLCNPVTFPSFAALSDLNDPSTNYFTGWDTGIIVRSREWALIGEVTELQHFMRHRFLLQTRFEEKLILAFYPETPPLPDFDVSKVKVGHTFALLNAEKKTFLDLTEGVRMEYLDTCWAFQASLNEVMEEAERLLNAADNKAQKVPANCFTCKKPTSSCCAKCGLAYFCSRECQAFAWPKHKRLCRDGAKLLSLSCLPRHPYVHRPGHFLSWHNIPGYVPLPKVSEVKKKSDVREKKTKPPEQYLSEVENVFGIMGIAENEDKEKVDAGDDFKELA
jgi:hypothetical protein